MIYKSSSGDKEIATMPLSYALNALRKLERTEPERVDEIAALKAHTDKLSAENTAKSLAGEAREPVIGDNGGPPLRDTSPRRSFAKDDPKPEGREAIEIHVDDLLTEAGNWADGVALERQEQADAVGKLQRMLQEAAKMVDDRAAVEKKPLQDAVAKVGDWQNGYTAKGLKKTPDGKLTKAILATSNLTTGWLRKQEAERKALADKLAMDAAKAAQDAIAQRQEAKASTDIEVMDKAEDALAAAKALIAQADGAAKEKVKAVAGDGYRAITLRSIWDAEVTNYAQAYAHYKTNPEFMEEFFALIRKYADRDAKHEATRRTIPGIIWHEKKVSR